MLVISSNYVGRGPYTCTDIQFNHDEQTCTFFDFTTKKLQTIDIEEIEEITIQKAEQ